MSEQSSVEKLESALSRVEFPKEYLEIEGYFDIKYVVGKVDYKPADNLNDLEHFLIKKEAFKHEAEIRGSVSKDEDEKPPAIIPDEKGQKDYTIQAAYFDKRIEQYGDAACKASIDGYDFSNSI